MRQYITQNANRLLAVTVVLALYAVGAIADPGLAGAMVAVPFMMGDTADFGSVKKLLEDQGKAFEEFKKTNDQLIQAKAEGKAVADLEAKLAKLQESLDKNEELKAQFEEAVKAANRPQINVDDTRAEAKTLRDFNAQIKSIAIDRKQATPAELTWDNFRAYKSAFVKCMTMGQNALTAEEAKAMSVGQDSDGGYLVPADVTGRIVTKLYDLSPIRQIANVQVISSDRLEGIEDTGEADAGWVGETGTRSDTTTPKVGKYEIPAHEMYAQPKATQKMLDDGAVDIEAWLAGKVSNKLARVEGAAFCVGNGVAKPMGFTMYTTAATADASRTWGQLEHVKSGANGAFASSNPADVLFDLEMAFKPGYLAGARWVTRRSVIQAIRKFKESTTNGYLWQPGLQAGQPSQLLGYPITMAEDMPALATDSLSLALGNFQEGYQIVDRLGMRTLRDPFTDKPYVKFYTIKRTGGAVVNFDAIKFIKFAA